MRISDLRNCIFKTNNFLILLSLEDNMYHVLCSTSLLCCLNLYSKHCVYYSLIHLHHNNIILEIHKPTHFFHANSPPAA